jgi:hypothetical protein
MILLNMNGHPIFWFGQPLEKYCMAACGLLRASLHLGEGDFSVAFCMHHDSICVCPDSLGYNMCILDTAIHLGPGTKAGSFLPRKVTWTHRGQVVFLAGQSEAAESWQIPPNVLSFYAIDTC